MLADFVGELTRRLTDSGVPYMITGSLAGSFHGEPRATRDVDVVIDPTRAALRQLVSSLETDGYYVSMDAAMEALDRRSQFNVIDTHSGWKADLIICRERPFSRAEFERRLRTTLLGRESYVASAEDTIISKLEWARAGDSERQLRDVAAILSTVGDELDRDYIGRWVDQLSLAELWDRVRAAAQDREVSSPAD
jgi:hypothetical protein